MSDYISILETLKELKEKYPSYNLGRHISTALSDYGDLWGLSDREFLFAIQKYSSELELDPTVISEEYIQSIIKDAENLTIEDE